MANNDKKEPDRRAALAAGIVVIYAGQIAAGVAAAIVGHPEVIDFIKETLLATTGFAGSVITFYFTRKGKETP